MLDRWESDDALDLLEGYVLWISAQKLGGIFEALYDSAGMLVARKVANSLPTRESPIPE